MAPQYSSISQSEYDTSAVDVAAASSPYASETTESVHAANAALHARTPPADSESVSGEVALVGGGHDASDDVDVLPTPKATRVARGFLNSLSSGHSYEMIEEDDYDDERPVADSPAAKPDALWSTQPAALSAEPRVRTASVPRHLPLNHPMPDLQSIQGAYTKNVERLEESAERLSATSSIDQGIRDINAAEQAALSRRSSRASDRSSLRRRHRGSFSGSSPSYSIIGLNRAARTGTFTPSAHAASPSGSIPSAGSARSRPVNGSQLLPEPDYEGGSLDFDEEPARPLPAVVEYQSQAGLLTVAPEHAPGHGPDAGSAQENSRPTIASHAGGEDPFSDFDGVHHGRASLDPDASSLYRAISLSRPPLARDSRAFKEAQPGESMVYYPAPVPVMLNLPPKLSKMSVAEREKRRLQALSAVPEELRKSAAWLKDTPPNLNASDRWSKLPPQLRASAFFDGPGTSMNLRLTNGSAVQTLDRILDAAANAPVSVFTDHPIAGKVGREVYGPDREARKSSSQAKPSSVRKSRRRSAVSNLLRLRRSSDALTDARQSRIPSRESHAIGTDDEEDAGAESLAPDDDELVDDDDDNDDGEDDAESTGSEHVPGFSVAPTTLLAELQVRKAQLKMRNRTAANAFPQGMHSTLLELDTVAQLQQKSRQTKHITLAWEDQHAAEDENFADEDIPLGVLFPERNKTALLNRHRPLGLMEKREMEENEPLSMRRARLRGEPIQPPGQAGSTAPPESIMRLDLPSSEALAEEDGETLAERRKRMKEERDKAAASTAGDLASDFASQLGLDDAKPPPALPVSKTADDEEETLAERRKRLKEEALRSSRNPSGSGEVSAAAARPDLRSSHSMASILQAYPNGVRQVSGGSAKLPAAAATQQQQQQQHQDLPADYFRGSAMPQIPAHMQGALPYYSQASLIQPQYNAAAAAAVATPGMMYGYGSAPLAMNGMPYGQYALYGQYGQYGQYGMMPPLTTQQRATIDRWRQGIA